MHRVVSISFVFPRSANCNAPSGSGRPVTVAVAVALRKVPWKWVVTLNPAVLKCSLETPRVMGPSPVQVAVTSMVVLLQSPTWLPVSS